MLKLDKEHSQWRSNKFRDHVVHIRHVDADYGYAGTSFVVQIGHVRGDDEEGKLLWLCQQKRKAVIHDDGTVVREDFKGHILADGVILFVVNHFAIFIYIFVASIHAPNE